MGSVSYKVSVPGSLMLFGEHAVLHRKQALVAAIDHYLQVTLVPRADDQIKIVSSVFGSCSIALGKFKVIKPYDYVLSAIQQYLSKIKNGFTLRITSDFSSTIGFGSSAAVTIATLGVLDRWLNQSQKPNFKRLYRQAVSVVRLVQGFGSGADVAASVFGGIVAYKMQPLSIKKLPNSLPLVAVYSGSKIATAKVVAKVEDRRKNFLSIFTHLYGAIDCCTKEAMVAMKKNQWDRLGELMNIHQGLHEALGVNNATLSELIFSLRSHPGIYGAKISGSGLGDCIIGLGKIGKKNTLKNKIDIAVSPSGIVYL